MKNSESIFWVVIGFIIVSFILGLIVLTSVQIEDRAVEREQRVDLYQECLKSSNETRKDYDKILELCSKSVDKIAGE